MLLYHCQQYQSSKKHITWIYASKEQLHKFHKTDLHTHPIESNMGISTQTNKQLLHFGLDLVVKMLYNYAV